MTTFMKNQPDALLRSVAVFVYLADGVTPAPQATNWVALKAATAALGTTNLPTAIAQVITAGVAGNSKTLTLAHDGSGTVTVTTAGNAITAHYQAGGANTVTQLQSALIADGQIQLVGGSFTGTNTLATADAVGPVAFTGGADQGFQIRQGGTTYANAAGTITSTGIDGEWVYTATQAETNFDGCELGVKVFRAGYTTMIMTVAMQLLLPSVNVSTLDSAAVTFIVDGVNIEGSYTLGDLMRLLSGVIAGKVSGFNTGNPVFLSLNGAKTRLTVTTDATGRTAITVGDLT